MNRQYIKTLAVFVITVATVTASYAQTENTRERLIDQLKNGTAPGLRFTSAKPVMHAPKDEISELQKKESQVSLIRKGIAPHMKFQAGTVNRTVEAGAAFTSPKTTMKHGALASDSANHQKEIPKTVVAPALPAQKAVEQTAPVGKQ